MFNTEFLITSLVVVLIPGTGVIYTISTSLFFGWRAGTAAAIGCTAGIIPHLTASILGLSAILHMSALAFQIIKYAGTLYLLYLAWSMWKDKSTISLDTEPSKKGLVDIVVKGFLINILNPKLSIFFLAFLPLFISPNTASPTMEMLGLSIVFMALTLIIFILYGFLASYTRQYVINSPTIMAWVKQSFASILALLGIKLALTEQ